MTNLGSPKGLSRMAAQLARLREFYATIAEDGELETGIDAREHDGPLELPLPRLGKATE